MFFLLFWHDKGITVKYIQLEYHVCLKTITLAFLSKFVARTICSHFGVKILVLLFSAEKKNKNE